MSSEFAATATEALAHCDNEDVRTELRQQLEAGKQNTSGDAIERSFGHYRKIILPDMTPHPRQKRKPVK